MKKGFLFPLLLIGIVAIHPLGASEKGDRLERQIFGKILRALARGNGQVDLYFYGTTLPEGLQDNPQVRLVRTPGNADVIVIASKRFDPDLARLRKPVLTLEYSLLKRYPNAVGAYFWQKGRPNIVMIRSRLQRAGIRLPREFDRFIDETLW